VRWKVLAIVVLVAVSAGAVAFSLGVFSPASTSATGLLTSTASMGTVTDQVAATGTVAASRTYGVAFGIAPWMISDSDSGATDPSGTTVTWTVDTVKVKVGDTVRKGDELATADTSDLESQIQDAARAAKSAALQLTSAQDDLDNAASGAPTRQAKVALYNAQTAKAKADADLAALKKQRQYATLKAPTDGVVTAVAVTPGADAASGAAITIASSTLVVETSVVESDVASIKLNQAATVAITALDATVDGTVTAIAPSADSSSGSGSSGVVSFAVTVQLAKAPTGLRSGMSADITIVTATAENVLTIPSRALSGSANSYSVRVVAADGTVATRPVTVGLVTDSLAEIKSGLAAGDAVVTGTSSSQSLGTNSGNGRGGFNGGGFGGPPGGGIITRGN
jgi:macrolide-specific efflux system membrane fusion protein